MTRRRYDLIKVARDRALSCDSARVYAPLRPQGVHGVKRKAGPDAGESDQTGLIEGFVKKEHAGQ